MWRRLAPLLEGHANGGDFGRTKGHSIAETSLIHSQLSCAALIVCYAFPVAFTGLLSNINTLTQTIHWLSWLSNAPSPIQSAIQGLLPQVILNTLLVLVPVLFRSLIHQQGVPTGNAKERAVQTWYFAFLFIQVFLVVTLSTGLYEFGQQVGPCMAQDIRGGLRWLTFTHF